MKKVIAINGSTRSASVNLQLIRIIQQLSREKFEISIYEGIADLPHFNPDLDTDHPPQKITGFRNTLRSYDGILICSPEYAMGVPGTLKNALDWTVSSMEFSKKPVALITASSMGQKAHESLLETLRIIESSIGAHMQLLISHARTKVTDGKISDRETLEKVLQLINALESEMQKPQSL
jgi:NAD(P)H-dependent FMN reductase